MGTAPRIGMPTRDFVRRCTLAFVAALVGTGCVVFRDPSAFEEPSNTPPVLVAFENDIPLGAILTIGGGVTDAGVGGDLPDFRATVRDPNVDETLFWRAYVNYAPNGPNEDPVDQGTLAPAVDRSALRAVTFEVGDFDLDMPPSCNRVELFVAPSFGAPDLQPPDDPEIDDNFAVATYWVLFPSETEPVDGALCNNARGVP